MAEETLIEKIRSLPPDRVAEVEDFVDFLAVASLYRVDASCHGWSTPASLNSNSLPARDA